MRWKFEESPVRPKEKIPKPKLHTEVHRWFDIDPDQKEVLKGISSKIRSVVPDARIFLFGSRITGCWDETSDYDLMICSKNASEEIQKEIRQMDFNVKVDLWFCDTLNNQPTKVEIE